MSCSGAGASLPGGGGGNVKPRPPGGGGGAGRPTACANGRPPNIIITGTRPFTSAGSTSVNEISTLMSGYALLSACPVTWRPTTLRPPTVPVSVATTVHVT